MCDAGNGRKGGAVDKRYGGLKKAYGEMLFCWQETAAGEWQKGRLTDEEKRKKETKSRFGRRPNCTGKE